MERNTGNAATRTTIPQPGSSSQLAALNGMESTQFSTEKLVHDFNNILTAIAGHVSFARSADSKMEANSALDAVLEATNRGAELIRRLRGTTVERNASGGIRWQQVAKEALSLLRGAMSRNIQVETALADDTPLVACTESEAHQVVMNLGLNAAAAMAEKGGTIHVSLRQLEVDPCITPQRWNASGGRYACLTVRDCGCGMTEETLARAFDPRFTTKPDRNSGLGLCVVKEVIARHEGFVEVESTLGAGTEFRVYLPLYHHQHGHDAIERANATLEGAIPR